MQTTNVKKQGTVMQSEIMQNAMVITKLNMPISMSISMPVCMLMSMLISICMSMSMCMPMSMYVNMPMNMSSLHKVRLRSGFL